MMSKEAMKQALDALEMNNAEWKALADSGDAGFWEAEDRDHYKQTNEAITALRQALANEALDRMAENARELGLDYEPAQQCNHCNGSGRMVRDPDIGTDQECFVCDGSGTFEPEQPAQQEPVAYRSRWRNTEGQIITGWVAHTDTTANPDPRLEIEPLYTRPQAREPLLREIAALSANALDDYKMIQSLMAEREPLTLDQLWRVFARSGLSQFHQRDGVVEYKYEKCIEEFARAIEAAHGIGEKK